MLAAGLITIALAGFPLSGAAADMVMPRYAHVFIIIEENHGFEQIIGNKSAPTINRLANEYGLATAFYASVHPSEANYVAMLGGDTFGIHDDDAYYCKPGVTRVGCERSAEPDYADHTVVTTGLTDQLAARGLTWKGYMEDIPEPGSTVFRWPSPDHPAPGRPMALYAVKHNGFMTFKTVQDDPARAAKIVGFDALDRDIAMGRLPNYAHIVPNQCNDMHGLDGPDVPADCAAANDGGRIARADHVVDEIVGKIMHSTIWNAPENAAIIITFDEDQHPKAADAPQGCCGYDPTSAANSGGGRIATVVITNHGPRGVRDPTPYNHYSLLRTTEAAFGIADYIGRAADESAGVVTMTPLFARPH